MTYAVFRKLYVIDSRSVTHSTDSAIVRRMRRKPITYICYFNSILELISIVIVLDVQVEIECKYR